METDTLPRDLHDMEDSLFGGSTTGAMRDARSMTAAEFDRFFNSKPPAAPTVLAYPGYTGMLADVAYYRDGDDYVNCVTGEVWKPGA